MAAGQRKSVADPQAVRDLLRRAVARVVPPEARDWFDGEVARQQSGLDERRLGIALGLVGRKLGRADLALTSDDVAAARKLRQGWQPERWSTDEAARVVLLLATYRGDDKEFAARIDRLCTTAEVTEHVAYLKGLAVYPAPSELHDRAREGVRSSIRPIFDAVACHNPYPFDYFDDAAWNQMVVKCVFVGASIDTIFGLRERRNPEGVEMLRALVSERAAAGRPSPDNVHAFIADTARNGGSAAPLRTTAYH
jgi:hypothetical protein